MRVLNIKHSALKKDIIFTEILARADVICSICILVLLIIILLVVILLGSSVKS
jgi:hypothetical protein